MRARKESSEKSTKKKAVADQSKVVVELKRHDKLIYSVVLKFNSVLPAGDSEQA